MMEADVCLLRGFVGADECYVGSKPRKSNKSEDRDNTHKRGRSIAKIPIIGIIERNGEVVPALTLVRKHNSTNWSWFFGVGKDCEALSTILLPHKKPIKSNKGSLSEPEERSKIEEIGSFAETCIFFRAYHWQNETFSLFDILNQESVNFINNPVSALKEREKLTIFLLISY